MIDRIFNPKRRPVRIRRANSSKSRPNLEVLDGRCLMDAGIGMAPTSAPAVMNVMPHPNDPQMHAEHMALLALVPREEATHVAESDGNWSAIWGNHPPEAGDRVLIPVGVTVTVDGEYAAALDWIRVDGTLRFATDIDTLLKVETIVVDTTGTFEMGTADAPVAANKRARVFFADTGPLDRAEDPFGLGRGLITHGGLSLHGAETTGFVPLAQAAPKGATILQLASDPVNWKVGGRLVLPGVHPDPRKNQDEELTIVAINGTSVTVNRPLTHDHSLPGGVALPLAYLDRNVVLTSENAAEPDRRGHVMVMHHSDQERSVSYAALDGLGRTRADMLVTDPEVNDHGHLLPPRDANGILLPMYANEPGVRNDRGRYSLHFHHTGTSYDEHPIMVKGISIADGLKWGVVSHQSYVVVEDSVTYRVDGAGFVTESGTEIGAFRHNLAIRSFGSRGQRPEGQAGVDTRQTGQKGNLPLIGGDDLGFQGYGFWLQGPLVQVEENIASGHAKEGFAFFSRGLLPEDSIPVANLPAGAEALQIDLRYNRPVDSVPIDRVPFEFARNTAFGSRIGLGVYNHFVSSNSRMYDLSSRISASDFVNVRTGFIAYYASRMTLDDVRIVNDPTLLPFGLPSDSGSEFYGDSGDITWNNVTIENFRVGIQIPRRGDMVVRGGFLKNTINIFIDNVGSSTVTLHVGAANFAKPSTQVLKALQTGRKDDPWNIYLATNSNPNSPDVSLPFRRTPTSVILYVDGQPEHLYFRESARGYRFDTADDFESRQLSSLLPDSIRVLSAGELWDQHRLAINDVIAPTDARTIPGIHGVVSPNPPNPPAPNLRLMSARHTNQLIGYTLQVRDPSGSVIDLVTTDLVPDAWNFVSGYHNGQMVTELIYAKAAPPTLQRTDHTYNLKSVPPTTISLSELQGGFTVYGKVTNQIGNLTHLTNYSQTFRPEQLVVDPDGKVRLLLTFSDIAGNQATMELVLTVV